MGYKLKTAPSLEPVALAEAKLHLKIDSDTTDDNLITALIVAAREQAEKYTGRALVEQVWEYYIDEFEDDEIELLHPPLMSITSITYIDPDNVTQTLSTSIYDADLHSEPGQIYLKYGKSWPSVLDIENSIKITYKAGYGATAASVPASIKAAILLLIGDLYENRQETIVGASVAKLPNGIQYLLDPYRVY